MIFIILHELGHMFAGIMLKLKPKKIEMNPFGLAITFQGIGKNISIKAPQKRILIAIAGPLVNLSIIVLALVFKLEDIILYSNILLLLFNLLPIYPLDGGRILKNVLQIKLDYWKALDITNNISNITIIIITIIASISMLYFKNIAIILMVLYLWILLIKENKHYQILKKIQNILKKEKITLENNYI